MAGRFVRSSKYRHVFGRPTRKEQCYDNLRISKNAWDTNLVKANPTYLSVNWEASGGGAFAVVPLSEKGRLPEQIPLFRGHTSAVLDTDWNPFDDSFIASGSDDGKVFLWKVPEGFTLHSGDEEPKDVSPLSKLTGHSRKVGHVLFNPAAENVLATASGDYTVKLWDVESGKARLNLKHGEIVQSLSWSADGSLLVTTSRDKKLRIWDVRQEKPAIEVPGHAGAKNSRAVWLGEHDRVATTGFSKMSDRQLGLWDVRQAQEPIGGFQILDSISGVCMPFWDEGTQCLYLAGKGDGNIRYFEYENDKFEYLSEYKSGDPQRGIAFIPKRGVNMHENEVTRAFKTVNDSYIEPISFIVPRRAEVFQGDIYPPATGSKPGVSGAAWFDGQSALPPKISLESLYDGEEPVDIPSEAKKAPATAQPTSKGPIDAPPPAKPTPAPFKDAPMLARTPPPQMEDQKASIAAMASKFADKDEEAENKNAEASSFDEPPVNRVEPVATKTTTAPAPRVSEPDTSTTVRSPPPYFPTISPMNSPTVSSSKVPTLGSSVGAKLHTPPAAVDSSSNGGPAIESSLAQIKTLLEQQNLTIAEQSDKIGLLTAEVDTLKTRVGESKSARDKDERIRELELELEQSRS